MKNAITITSLVIVLIVTGCASNEEGSESSSTESARVQAQQGDVREIPAPPMKPIKMNPPVSDPTQKPNPKYQPKQTTKTDKVKAVKAIQCEWDMVRALRRSQAMMVAAAETFNTSTIPNAEAFERALTLQRGIEKNISNIMTFAYNHTDSTEYFRVFYNLAIAQDLLTQRTIEIAAHWETLSKSEKSQQKEIERFATLRQLRYEKQKALAVLLKGINEGIKKKILDDE